jgi:hypothetical protein
VGVTGLNLYRLLMAVVVAAMVLAVWHAVRGIDRLALGSKKKGGGELPATFSLVRHRETQSPEI